MKKIYLLFLALLIVSCSKSDDEYVPIPEVTSPVVVNLANVPFPKLSDYHFFEGDIKNQSPSLNVIPYKPASELFSDYAHKKRFIWLPKGTKASYNGDGNVFEFPVGTALIKTFYYDNVQLINGIPSNNATKIIETRLLIRKSSGWFAYDYIWNANQTEADLETTGRGVVVPITWLENNISKSINYKTPSQNECATCHKINPNQTGEIMIPIGVKPQNLNNDYNYNGTIQNQIAKWKSVGYLGNDIPLTINSTVDWHDTSKSLELRARSYVDINCAHCHRVGGHCDYTPQRFNFSNSNLSTFGVCLPPSNLTLGDYIIKGGFPSQSVMSIRMNTTVPSDMMPIIGRTVIDTEGVQLINQWIGSLPACR